MADGDALVRPLEPAISCTLTAPPRDRETPLGPFVSSTVGGPVWVAPALDEPAPVSGPIAMPWEEEDDGDPAAGLDEEGNALAYGFESPAADETAEEEFVPGFADLLDAGDAAAGDESVPEFVDFLDLGEEAVATPAAGEDESGEYQWINFDEEPESGPGEALDEWFAALEIPADDGTFEGAALAALDALGAGSDDESGGHPTAEPEAEPDDGPAAELAAEPATERATDAGADDEPDDLAFEATGRRPAATFQPTPAEPDYDGLRPGAAGFEVPADDAGPVPAAFGSEAATTHALRVAGRLQALGDELARSGEDALARWVREGDRFDTLLAGVVAGYLAAREE